MHTSRKGFLAIHELRLTLYKKKDTFLPLRSLEDPAYPNIKTGATIILGRELLLRDYNNTHLLSLAHSLPKDRQRSIGCMVAEQISQHYVAIYTHVVLILEPKEHKFAVVRQCIPLPTLEVKKQSTTPSSPFHPCTRTHSPTHPAHIARNKRDINVCNNISFPTKNRYKQIKRTPCGCTWRATAGPIP